ncbi:MAG: Gfo/Idh/MocA family oxidoreductase [Anaerolineaceae bacterium]|nr:Gfo/Idh/MocA family oxidoreductase [Anaerolineaceae bacterium]
MSQVVKICMIGAGRVGKLHSGTIRRYIPGGNVVALVDNQQSMLDETGAEFGIEGRFTSLEEALNKADFDAVIITTPTFTHRDLTVMAADKRKHVFLEKPMAMSLQECDEIIEVCDRNGSLLQLGYMRHFDPDFALAYQRIQAGEIGEPMLVKSLTHGPGLPPPWACDIKTSNGNLAEVNSHDLDATRWLMGSNPMRIYLEVANFKGAERGVFTENYYDNMIASLKFESGGLGSISGVCPCDYGYDARMEIVGKKGIMIVGGMENNSLTVGIDRDTGLVTPIFRRWPDRFYMGYIHEIEHFIKSIQYDTAPKVGGEEGRWAVAGVLAGTKSLLEERPVLYSEVM